MSNLKTFNALLRNDFASFIQKTFATVSPGTPFLPNWHIQAIAYQLERCYRREINRLIITLPPRNMKSIAGSVAFTAWLLGLDPTYKIINVSYGADLVAKHGIDTRRVMESDWYKNLFPRTRIDQNKNTQTELMTTAGGVRFASSVHGSLTGRGGNIIIIDDPHKLDDMMSVSQLENTIEWYRTTLLSRLDNKQSDVIILIQQRVHENDLAGYLMGTGGWVHLNLPAIAEDDEQISLGREGMYTRRAGEALHPARESLEILNKLKQELGSFQFAALYQQRPVPIEGGMIKWPWFMTYDKIPDKSSGDKIIQSWDTASKAEAIHDYSVCITFLVKKKKYYILDVYRERLEYPMLKKVIPKHAKRWDANLVIIEDKNAGTQLIQELKGDSDLNIKKYNPVEDKVTRMMMGTFMIEGGRVFVPVEAPWLADFKHELLMFPKGKHDDQVDCLSQFLDWAKKHSGRQITAADFVFSEESAVMKEFPDIGPYPFHDNDPYFNY